MQRESIEFDVVIVGGGPAGLAAAIRIRQLAAERGTDISVCVVEKGAEIGAHILSGAVMDPRALDELVPDWRERGAPLDTAVTEDRFVFLSEARAWRVPGALLPGCFHNRGNYIVSLGRVCRWLGGVAEELGAEIFPGFAASELLYDESGAVRGVATGDMGVGRDGQANASYQPGIEILGKYTLLAEGCRGHLGKQVERRFGLRREADPQVYGLGIKELWEVPPARHRPGLVQHTAGWPLGADTYGGSWLYHQADNLVSIGFVVGLGYANPYLSPFEEFQRFKLHPHIRATLEGGRRIAYGARAIAAGGLQSLPRLVFPGGALLGDDAGFLNASRIKGSHAAIKSGSLAGEAVAEALAAGRSADELLAYPEKFRGSWLHAELHRARNFKPWMGKGLVLGALMVGIDQLLLRGKAPWTLRHTPDHEKLEPAARHTPIDYPKPDGRLSFDRLSSVYLSNTNHAEDQPCHLKLREPARAIEVNHARFASPETRYCPAGVYEIVREGADDTPRLQINAQNCVHCKSCDIKDPLQNIDWTAPHGGEGPVYSAM